MCLFDLKLLYLLGVSPEFRECVICGNKDIEDGKFSVENGGVICNKHLINYVNLDVVETKALKLIYYIKPFLEVKLCGVILLRRLYLF